MSQQEKFTWIATISYEEATGKLKSLYERIKGADNNVDNIMMAHSLRPHTMEGHMAIYKYVLHHSANQIEKWFLEAIGTYVSYLNKCEYCYEHHFVGMSRLLDNEVYSNSIRQAIEEDNLAAAFNQQEVMVMDYAKKLSLSPAHMQEEDIQMLRDAGFDDGQILEINQVTSYFAYANRTVLGSVSYTHLTLPTTPYV